MTGLKSLNYAVFSVSDFDAWRDFGENIAGMQFSPRADGSAGLRMDEYDYRLLLEQGPDDDIAAAGWDLGSAEALDAYVHALNAKGVPVRRADDALAEKRGIEALYVCNDPNGFRHEFCASRKPSSAPFVSRTLRGAGFKTGDLGVGHILPVARDYQESIAFYRDKLGLLYSDRIIQQVAPDITADAMFFHTETGRHHSLATGQFPSAKRLNHLMVEYLDMNDVGAAYDRAVAAEVEVGPAVGQAGGTAENQPDLGRGHRIDPLVQPRVGGPQHPPVGGHGEQQPEQHQVAQRADDGFSRHGLNLPETAPAGKAAAHTLSPFLLRVLILLVILILILILIPLANA